MTKAAREKYKPHEAFSVFLLIQLGIAGAWKITCTQTSENLLSQQIALYNSTRKMSKWLTFPRTARNQVPQ